MKGGRASTVGWVQSWLKPLALASVHFYQVALRLVNPWGCKFHPSCSRYTAEAIERHGPWRGGRLALGRLWRCRPGVFGGYDPVPAAPGSGRGESGTLVNGPLEQRENAAR